MSNHTPTPWSISGDLIVGAPEAVPNPQVAPYPKQVSKLQWDYEGDSGATERRIQWPEAKANADFIVRAVNAHDDLLAALRKLAEIGEGGVVERRETGKPTWYALDVVAHIALAAIAQATT